MLKIIARSRIKAGQMDAYLAAVRELVACSQAEEGNVSYTLNRSRENPDEVAFIEVWKDQAAFEFHTKTPHFTQILPTLREYVAEGYPALFYEEITL